MMNKRLALGLTCGILAVITACQAGVGGKTAGKQKPKSKDGKTVVTLSLKGPNPYYEAAVTKFQEKHPEIDVQIQSFKQPGKDWNKGEYEKYIKTTNTALMSGKGADLIEAGGLPIEKLVNKKLLLNLSDRLAQDKTLNQSDLLTNILDASKVDGSLYYMPSGFYLRAFVGDEDFLKKKEVKIDDKTWNWQRFEDIARTLVQRAESDNERRYALGSEVPEVILQEWVVDSGEQFIDRTAQKAKFDSSAFTDLLRQVKKMYDDKILTSELAENQKVLFHTARFFSTDSLIQATYSMFANPKLLQKPHPAGKTGGIPIIIDSKLALTANSAVKEEAWKFLAFLLSEEVQLLPDRQGFSLLKSVNEKKLSEIQSQMKAGTYKLDSGKTVTAPEEDFTQFKQFLSTADRYSEADVTILGIISDESAAFFSGQKSAEEVAQLIQNRATLYLNE